MRKLAVIAVSAVLGGLVASPTALANHGHDRDSDDNFTLTGNFTDFDAEDNGRRGWSEGDKIDFEFDLYDRRDFAGDGDGTCKVKDVDRDDHEFTADCDVTFDLDDGTLDMEGEVTERDFHRGRIKLDVVDGSGDYDDADGTATFSGGDRHRYDHDYDYRDRRHRKGHHGYQAAGFESFGDYGDGYDHRDRDHHRDHYRGNDFRVRVNLD
ncbi:MAG: allene oxide cyclase barrel-like domain-containing protein [Acidimicrobiia bacterium]